MASSNSAECNEAILDTFGDSEVPLWEHAQAVALTGFVVCGLYFLVPTALMWHRRRVYPVNLKPALLVQAHVLGFVCVMIVTIGTEAFGQENMPCDLLLWARTLIITLVVGPFVLFLANLHSRAKLARAMQEFNVRDPKSSLDGLVRKARKASWRQQLRIMFFILVPTAIYAAVNYRKDFYGSGCFGCGQETEEALVVAAVAVICFVWCVWYLAIKLRSGEDPMGLRRDLVRVLVASTVAGLIFVVLEEVDPEKLNASGRFDAGWVLIMVCLYAHTVNCVLPLARSFKDTSKRVQAQAELHRYSLPARRTVAHGGNGNGPSGKAAAAAATAAARGRRSFLRPIGSFYSLSSVDSMEDPEDLSLGTVLATTDGFELFQHFLSLEFNVEPVLFLKAAREWRVHYATTIEIEAREAVARTIYSAFVPDGAPMQVNLRHSQKRALAEVFEGRQAGLVKPPTVFDDAIEEIFKLLEQDAFPRFQRTEAFQRFAEGK